MSEYGASTDALHTATLIMMVIALIVNAGGTILSINSDNEATPQAAIRMLRLLLSPESLPVVFSGCSCHLLELIVRAVIARMFAEAVKLLEDLQRYRDLHDRDVRGWGGGVGFVKMCDVRWHTLQAAAAYWTRNARFIPPDSYTALSLAHVRFLAVFFEPFTLAVDALQRDAASMATVLRQLQRLKVHVARYAASAVAFEQDVAVCTSGLMEERLRSQHIPAVIVVLAAVELHASGAVPDDDVAEAAAAWVVGEGAALGATLWLKRKAPPHVKLCVSRVLDEVGGYAGVVAASRGLPRSLRARARACVCVCVRARACVCVCRCPSRCRTPQLQLACARAALLVEQWGNFCCSAWTLAISSPAGVAAMMCGLPRLAFLGCVVRCAADIAASQAAVERDNSFIGRHCTPIRAHERNRLSEAKIRLALTSSRAPRSPRQPRRRHVPAPDACASVPPGTPAVAPPQLPALSGPGVAAPRSASAGGATPRLPSPTDSASYVSGSPVRCRRASPEWAGSAPPSASRPAPSSSAPPASGIDPALARSLASASVVGSSASSDTGAHASHGSDGVGDTRAHWGVCGALCCAEADALALRDAATLAPAGGAAAAPAAADRALPELVAGCAPSHFRLWRLQRKWPAPPVPPKAAAAAPAAAAPDDAASRAAILAALARARRGLSVASLRAAGIAVPPARRGSGAAVADIAFPSPAAAAAPARGGTRGRRGAGRGGRAAASAGGGAAPRTRRPRAPSTGPPRAAVAAVAGGVAAAAAAQKRARGT
jgi:hypothetical protein